MATWDFKEKDGTTAICSISDSCAVEVEGKISKTFRFMLTSSAEYNNLISMCDNTEPYFAKRTPMKGAILFVDKSPSQGNTIKIVDPRGIDTGYGIIENFKPDILPGHGDVVRTFELTLLWIGSSLGSEIQSGVYKITLS